MLQILKNPHPLKSATVNIQRHQNLIFFHPKIDETDGEPNHYLE